ncbi:MAG: phosphoenolpyruvate carboxykinase (ATP), partial [Gemmatimonadetes bacterium]|nr:phosphoenolpyruvate carboxykinase (ATP) [Gemmatimonadota bacterium]
MQSARGEETVKYDPAAVLEKVRELVARSRRVGTNVTGYTGPEIGRLAESVGQRNIFGGYNWDTRVTSRSARFTAVVGSGAVESNPSNVMELMEPDLVRVFGGELDGKAYAGHANQLPVDYMHRVMGSCEDPDFTFNCNLLVTTKNRANHHIPYMWGKMLLEIDRVEGVDDLYMLLVPDVRTGDFGRFYCMADHGVTVGVGSDYMGEAKKGFLRMAMFRAKQRGILGIHAGTKIVDALDMATGRLKRYGIAIFGNSGTGKTTNIGHSHFLDREGERALVVQDDFAGLRLRDGRVLGTEQAMFLKTDLDEDDILLGPMTES